MKTKLNLKKETIQNLTTEQMAHVAGASENPYLLYSGYAGPTNSCNSCNTCNSSC